MAAPSYVSAGTGATDAGSDWSYTCQASAAAGNVFIVQILQDGATTGAISSVVGTNIEALDGTDNTWTVIYQDHPAGVPQAGCHSLYIGRALSTSAPTISGANSTSEDLYIRSYQFTNVSTGTTLATVREGLGYTRDTSATADHGSLTTVGPDRLALAFLAVNDDNAIAQFSGQTGGRWVEAEAEYAESSGTDGAVQLQYARPGTISSWPTDSGSVTVLGSGGANEQQAQSFTTAGAVTATVVQMRATLNGGPTDDLIVEIQTDSSGSPSGNVVGTGSTTPAASVVSGYVNYFAVSASLSASTTYWIVARRSGARNETSYFTIGRGTGDTYAGGAAKTMASGTWSAATNDLLFGIETTSGGTISGGTASITDIDAWSCITLALIGTTVAATTSLPPIRPYPYHLITR